jgi:hypothetical protein
MAQYESDLTKFMREFLTQHPDQVAEQKAGRALWWDKPQDLDDQARNRESRVPQRAYYYQTEDWDRT